MKKRLLSLILSVSIAISIISIPPALAEGGFTQATPNKDILENILNGDRHFVIDTLIGNSGFHTDFSTNPHAIVNLIGDENTMMDNVLTQYQKDKTYKAAVDLMEKIYNSDEYAASITDFITEHAADLLSIFSTDAANFTSDLTYSKSQLNYESILKEVLTSDYTSSDGVTLSTKEIELEELERLSKGVKNLKAFADFFKSNASANHMGDDTFDDRMSYYNDYLIPYADNMSSALTAFSELQDTNGKTEERQINDAIAFTTALATLVQMDRYETANDEMSSDIVYYAPTFFVSDDALKIIKQGDKAISTVSKTLSAYMFIEAIATQTNSMKGALTRMSATANPSLKPILQTFANEIGEAGNKKLVGYESLMQYIRNQGVVKEIGKDTAEKLSSKLLKKLEFTNAGLAYTATSKVISGATNVAGITSWCADKAVSFGDTCKKTYELKYLRTLIARAVSTYKDDLATYQSNKTDKNARNVLDDLMLIQKLRLRGETIAYKMTQGQWDSPIGRLLATGTLNADEMMMNFLDESYQARVDAFIGASVMPLSTESFTIGNGESMSINYRADAGLYANINKNGKQYSVAELQYKLINGITVNSGGQILVASDVNRNMAIPFIINNGGNVLVASGTKISELTQNSGTTTFGGGNFNIDSLAVNGGTVTSNVGGTITCKDLSLSNATINNLPIICSGVASMSGDVIIPSVTAKMINQSSGTLTVNGDIISSGDINFGGTVTQNSGLTKLNGDITGSGDTVILDNLELSGKLPQTISRQITVNNFYNHNYKGLTTSSEITVKGTARSVSTITNGQNVVMTETASFPDSTYYGDITIKGLSGNLPATVKGNVYIKGNINQTSSTKATSFQMSSGTMSIKNANVTLTGAINLSGGNISLTNSTATVQSVFTTSSGTSINVDKDSQITFFDISSQGTISGDGIFKFYGDIQNGGIMDIGTMNLTQNLPTSINGNNISVKNLSITGKGTATLSTNINVSDKYSTNGNVVNDTYIKLGIGQRLTENQTFDSQLTFSEDVIIDGVTITAKKGLTLSNCNLVIRNDGQLISKGISITNGNITLLDNAELTVNGLTNITGSSSNRVSIDETSEAHFNKLTIISNIGGITVNGTLQFGSDASLTSTTIQGNGTIKLYGDLIGCSLTVNQPKNFDIVGKLPQTISASGSNFFNLFVDNPSTGGVKFNSTVYYYGTYTKHDSKVTGTVTER